MANYRRMYAILCGAIDDCIDGLRQIPLAVPYANKLEKALLDAEEEYLKDSSGELFYELNDEN